MIGYDLDLTDIGNVLKTNVKQIITDGTWEQQTELFWEQYVDFAWEDWN